MTGLTQALESMRGVTEEFANAQHAIPIAEPATYLQPLAAEVLRLQSIIENGAPPRMRVDALETWAKWKRALFAADSLDRREWQAICVSPETAWRPELIMALKEDGIRLRRLSTLLGFAHVYFGLWGALENQKEVEALIITALHHADIRNRGRVIARWRESPFLFTQQAHVRLAERLVRGNTSPEIVREQFFLQKDTRLLRRATEVAVERMVDRICESASKLSEASALLDLKFLQDGLLGPAFDPEEFRTALSRLIMSDLPMRFPAVQTMLVQWVHDDLRLGDPRLSHRAPNWRLVDTAARSRFLAWLAKETLEFFFNTIVPEDAENRRRANFWIAYARAGLIRDFNVVVCHQDEPKMRRSRAKFIPGYARLDANESNQTSAFLMVLEGYGKEYVVAEFSETGNAAHVCRRSAFEIEGVRLHNTVFRRRQIHNPSRAELRILHSHSWEATAKRALANQLGIRL